MANRRIEWREIVDVTSIELYRPDVLELIKILSEHELDEKVEITMEINIDSKTIQIDPINEDFLNIGITSSNQVTISQRLWKENNIVSGVSLTMHVNYVNYQIHSYSETWFLGKKEQLNRFFERRKPVIPKKSRTYKAFKVISNIVFLVSFGLTFYFLIKANYIFTGLSGALAILTAVIPVREPKLNIPPYVVVFFYDRPLDSVVEKKDIPWVMIIEILALIVAIIGLFI
jgi:hypothetical protein